MYVNNFNKINGFVLNMKKYFKKLLFSQLRRIEMNVVF